MFGVAAANQIKNSSRAGAIVMTRSRRDGEMDQSLRAMTAEDQAVEYLHHNHRSHAAEIAMRVMYRFATRWKIERDYRLNCYPNDPRLTFHISDEHVHELHQLAAVLPIPSQSDSLAEHYLMTLLAQFEPDRAWWTSRKVYNGAVWPLGPYLANLVATFQ
jgi:hypothetical protein